MTTKAEDTILGELLRETRANRVVRQEQGEVLARLDERTQAIQSHLESTVTDLHGRISGVENRFEDRVKAVEQRFGSRITRRSATVASVVVVIVGVVLTFALNAIGYPNG